MTAKQSRFSVGDVVEPKPEWVDNPNEIPSGTVREIAPFGDDGALYVGDVHRAFAAYVFQPSNLTNESPVTSDPLNVGVS